MIKSRNITPSTVKKLFGLSGNRCALPGCNQKLIDENNNILAQICHIEAAEPGGERYNPDQIDDERRNFSNLILLCANCHVVTNDIVRYTVEILKQIKSEHENRSHSNFEITNENLDRVINKYNNQYNINNYNSSTKDSYNKSQLIINNVSGLTYQEAKDISLDVFRNNFMKLAGEAQKIANDKIEKFTDDFLSKLKNESEELFNKMNNPSFQHSLYNAQKGYVLSEDENSKELYLNLLLEKLKSENKNKFKMAIDEAIIAIAKLNNKDIKILTLLFLITVDRLHLKNLNELIISFKKEIIPILENEEIKNNDIDLEYTNVVILFQHKSLIQLIAKKYINIFTENFSKIEFENYIKDDRLKIFIEPTLDNIYSFKPVSLKEINDFCKINNVSSNVESALEAFINIKQFADFDIEKILKDEISGMDKLINIWDNTKLSFLTLTLVGKIIAIINFNTYSKEKINLADLKNII